jgi:hypothetical protein
MQGKFNPKNPNKYKGDLKDIVFRSSWERTVMVMCDNNPHILEWSSESIVIPYISPVDGKAHRYFMDFWMKVKQHDGSSKVFLIEVKPKSQTKPPKRTKNKKEDVFLTEVRTYSVNQAKWKAAREYCKSRGWEFKVWTEDQILPK